MMIEILRGKLYIDTSYEVVFDDGAGNGYDFPCDNEGKLLSDISEAMKRNYRQCMDHPEQFQRWNTVIERKIRVKDPDEGICECGIRFPLISRYMGACQCPRYGKWYNVFGQELLQPEEWER